MIYFLSLGTRFAHGKRNYAIVGFSAEHTTSPDNSLSLREQKCVKVKEGPGIIKDDDHSRWRDGNAGRLIYLGITVFPLGGIRGRTCEREPEEEWIFTSCWTLSFCERFSFYFLFFCKALRTFFSHSIPHNHCLGTQGLPQLWPYRALFPSKETWRIRTCLLQSVKAGKDGAPDVRWLRCPLCLSSGLAGSQTRWDLVRGLTARSLPCSDRCSPYLPIWVLLILGHNDF